MYKLIVVLLTDRFKLSAKVRTFFESYKYFGKKWQPRGCQHSSDAFEKRSDAFENVEKLE
jgi:hypothetical protein